MYESFAYVYDLFMENIPYDKWAESIYSILERNGIVDGLLLDMGCGTGVMTRLLKAKGFDMIGIDASEDMLMVARELEYDALAEEELAEDADIEAVSAQTLYLCQDMRELQLYGTVRATVSTCNCMNYLLTVEDLTSVFSLIGNYLDAGGLFIWDMNTPYMYENIPDSVSENRETAAFIWNNEYDESTHLNTYELNLFIQEEDSELFARETEIHVQRAFTLEEVKIALTAGGLELVSVVDLDTGLDITEETMRWQFVARELPREGKLYV